MYRVVAAIFCLGLVAAGDALAGHALAGNHWDGDAGFFVSLIPGEPLTEAELDQYYGRGIQVTFDLGDGNVFTLDDFQVNNTNDSTNFLEQSNSSEISWNSGILQNTPIIGNNNQVTINVGITVNMNTVTVVDSSGSSINVNQSLALSGALSAFGN
jgi:hypothetical protein